MPVSVGVCICMLQAKILLVMVGVVQVGGIANSGHNVVSILQVVRRSQAEVDGKFPLGKLLI